MDINELALSPNVKVYDLKSLVLKIYREYIHKLEIIMINKEYCSWIIEVIQNKVLDYEEIIDEIMIFIIEKIRLNLIIVILRLMILI